MSTIEIRSISKHFDKTRALHNVSLAFEPDKIYGILGRNGAGKTTLLNIITNKVFASAGDVLVDGERATENDRAQAKIYCMDEKNTHPGEMRVKEGFSWAREFYRSFDMEYARTLA
jgi:ABC-2 type transport system ATP-binding protein